MRYRQTIWLLEKRQIFLKKLYVKKNTVLFVNVMYLFSRSLKLIVARGMQDACKGHTIYNEDTIITFIFYLTLSIYLNHFFISVVMIWLPSKYIKVFLRTFVAYKKTHSTFH